MARDPDRLVAELRKARVVDHPRLGRDLDAHPPRQPLTNQSRRPRRLVDELLQTLIIAVLESGGHRLDALALALQHQPAQIHRTPSAQTSPPQTPPGVPGPAPARSPTTQPPPPSSPPRPTL